MRVLVLGANGMLGNAMMRVLSKKNDWRVFGTIRSLGVKTYFADEASERVVAGLDVENHAALVKVFGQIRPNIIINCIALNKQLVDEGDPLFTIPINALLPHRLAGLCNLIGARLVHISTDGIFSGKKGAYTERDTADAMDRYGISKFLGEVDSSNCLTLRTSVIGHELKRKNGLVEWFLSQKRNVRGYTKAIYSGLPAIELAGIIRDYILPNDNLSGIYHVSSDPISKYELLCLIADKYKKRIVIEPFDEVVIDRSLDSSAFQSLTGYRPPPWPELVHNMYLDYVKHKERMYV
jgi:dTDP-4-dehydrorhamnose reductase